MKEMTEKIPGHNLFDVLDKIARAFDYFKEMSKPGAVYSPIDYAEKDFIRIINLIGQNDIKKEILEFKQAFKLKSEEVEKEMYSEVLSRHSEVFLEGTELSNKRLLRKERLMNENRSLLEKRKKRYLEIITDFKEGRISEKELIKIIKEENLEPELSDKELIRRINEIYNDEDIEKVIKRAFDLELKNEIIGKALSLYILEKMQTLDRNFDNLNRDSLGKNFGNFLGILMALSHKFFFSNYFQVNKYGQEVLEGIKNTIRIIHENIHPEIKFEYCAKRILYEYELNTTVENKGYPVQRNENYGNLAKAIESILSTGGTSINIIKRVDYTEKEILASNLKLMESTEKLGMIDLIEARPETSSVLVAFFLDNESGRMIEFMPIDRIQSIRIGEMIQYKNAKGETYYHFGHSGIFEIKFVFNKKGYSFYISEVKYNYDASKYVKNMIRNSIRDFNAKYADKIFNIKEKSIATRVA
ncbi:hypothetical protein HYU23_03170 [Candidatus Woesearchaeota archaeon]|nr:hypothetical protein [Candidatus Woesearchaeota archaeon]